MSETFKVLTARHDKIEVLVNELAVKYQVMSFTVSVAHDEIWVTAIMIDKRELPRPQAGISLPGGGRPPFGS